MVKLIKASNIHIDFTLRFNLKDIEDVYIIMYKNEKVGVLEYKEKIKYFIEEETEKSIYIEYIEVLEPYRRKGIAREIIKALYTDDIDFMYGNAIPTSVDFWKSLDADFDGEDKNINYYLTNNNCLSFTI